MRLRLLVLFFLLASWALASTWTAATCNYADVNGLINNTGGSQQHLAVDGDVINIPPGTCTWTTQLTVNVGISIIGAGYTATTLVDAVPSPMFNVTIPLPTSSTFRISSMTIAGGGQNVRYAFATIAGTCNVTTCSHIRLDQLDFPAWKYTVDFSGEMTQIDNCFGVIDHNAISLPGGGTMFELNNSSWQGMGMAGDNSWAQPDTFGTDQALYIENNTFSITSGNGFAVTDSGSGGGARFVGRFNHSNGNTWQVHGTESTGRARGGRQLEIYNNTIVFAYDAGTSATGVGLRSGTVLAFQNTYDNGGHAYNGYINYEVSMTNYRDNNDFQVWGLCNGLKVWDYNMGASGPNGSGPGMVYATGTVSASTLSGTNLTVTDSTQSWTASQWVATPPYTIVDISRTYNTVTCGTCSGDNLSAIIMSSTANNVGSTRYGSWNGGANAVLFMPGDTYQILKPTVCIDQAGHGHGDSGSGGLYPNTPAAWINEVLDPVYQWAGTYANGGTGNPNLGGWVYNNETTRFVANQDYYQQVSATGGPQTSNTMPFDGLHGGTGFGTLANRPTMCNPSVGYWATDQGNWNQSGSGGQGQLYVCTSAGPPAVWTLYYTPYTYPHPLDTGGNTPPPLTRSRGVAAVTSFSGGIH